ncbi:MULTISPECIES: M15 family metallopeptidase [Bacillaceae]|uniref:M15 family metallopeptidase n=1 Tax=Halalkalibacter alkaliphilus TaxID=2917993 RepID=A0A9X2I3J1_9BACI|nr:MULTISPECIES: M15 family metallopeptidase [Bacillaceae]MCL7747292.1 M15 family metallopeptidase [Halalkalibacter alkaliphilus]MDT8860514.1 M15 family metallopeptidase [Alkalihalobacillus sp. MEB130]
MRYFYIAALAVVFVILIVIYKENSLLTNSTKEENKEMLLSDYLSTDDGKMKNKNGDIDSAPIKNSIDKGEQSQEDLAKDKPWESYTEEQLDDVLLLVNKERNLPKDYVPSDLVEPNVPFPFIEDLPQRLMRQEAAEALEDLFEKANDDNLNLYAQSGYRSYERQESIFAYYVERSGEEKASQVSANAGHSEHQTGLAMDVTSPEVNFQLVTSFEDTPEGQWIKENAAQFGFIIRYPKDKEKITGYQYEPWHLRFVGKEPAKVIYEQGLTLEEYLGFE